MILNDDDYRTLVEVLTECKDWVGVQPKVVGTDKEVVYLRSRIELLLKKLQEGVP